MPSKSKFKQSTLVHSMHLIFKMQSFPKLICSGFLISYCISVAYADEEAVVVAENSTIERMKDQVKSIPSPEIPYETFNLSSEYYNPAQDSVAALKQQEEAPSQIDTLKPIQLDENLEHLPVIAVDQNMANEIFQIAEEAKNDALAYRENVAKNPELVVNEATQSELTEISNPPVNIDRLMQEIQADSQIIVEANESGRTLAELQPKTEQVEEKLAFLNV